MDSKIRMDMPFVTFLLNGTAFAISAQNVQEMVTLQETWEVPETPDFVRGLMTLRNNAIPIIDLRCRLGIQSLKAELQEQSIQLSQRRQDHVNWLNELKVSVQENRDFTLATDPHKCAFGKWYDRFHPNSTSLTYYLRKFVEPHARIHALAIRVEDLKREGNNDDARALIAQTETGDLRQMIHLFDGLDTVMQESHRETVLVLVTADDPETQVGVCVDQVLDVSSLVPLAEAPELQRMKYMSDEGLVMGVVRAAKDDDIIQVLDADRLLQTSLQAIG